MIRAAFNFFTAYQVDVWTKPLDDLLFSASVGPKEFGALFDYRVALTFLSRWKDKKLLENPLFAQVKVSFVV